MTKVKSNPPKQTTTNNQFELIDLDLVKSEPDETVSSPVTTTSVAKSQNDNANQDYVGNPIVIAPHVSPRAVGKPVPVALNVPAGTAIQQANYTLTGATSGQPSKTFLLINNRTGVQSMLLSGNAVGRKPFSGVIESSQLPQIRVRTSAGGMQTIVSNQGPRTSSSSLVVAQKQSESGTSSRMIMDGGTISAVRPCINASEFQSRPASTVSDIIFTSRSIDPDGTVKTIKEYLCNFCQYKVSVQSEFEAHKSTHTFSCNHCKFKALTRFDVLKHKKQKHLNCSEELAGYHDLDKLMESVSAAQVFTTTSSPTTSSVPPQLYTAEPQRPPSSEPPLLELQNVPLSLAASLERSPTVAAANDDPKVPDENFDEESRKSDSMDSGTQNSRNVVGSSTEAPAVDAKETTTRLSRPRRAVAEKKMTLRDMDSDSQAELDNKTDDDDWEEKVPKNSGKKRSRKVLDPNKVAKTPEALKTLLDQPTQDQADTPRRLSCMRYKCSSCPFETVNTLALSEHIKTHDVSQNLDPSKSQTTSANKIMRDPNQPLSAVHWSCFYCNLSSVSQATIVSHVMKAHPGNAIQLKRISVPQTLQQLQSYPESSAAAATSADNSQTLVPGRTSPPVQAQNAAPNQQHQPIKQGTVTKSRASNPENEGCLWGCYYCNIQSVERSEVIAHLKREHHDLKLIVTRRRITHIPANFKAANKDSETEKLAEEKSDSVDAGKNKEPQDEICGGDSEKTAPSSERDDEAKGRPSKRKSSGGKKKKSLVNVSSEPRVLRSRRVSPGSLSPSLRDGSPSHVSVNSSEGMGPPSKKRKGRQDDHDKSSCGTPSAAGDTEVGDYNESKQAEQQQLDKQKTIFVRKILDYPKPLSMKSLMEELRWKCSFCEFKTGSRSKVVYHNMSNHPEKPVRFHRLLRGRALDCGESFNSRLRGPRSARETNLLKNGNWLWQCPVCDRKHISKGYLNVHLKVAHPRQASRLVGLAPSRKCKSVRASEDKTKRCSISLVRAEDMVHYDSLSNVLLDNGLSLVKSLDVDDDLECDVVRHRKYKCGKCNVRGFRPMIVKQHFLEAHSATEVLVLDLKNSQKNKYGDGCTLYSCLKGDCKFFTANKTELEGHYNDYAEHARTGPHQVERRRGLNGSDSEITDPSFERTSENRPVECRDSVAAKDVPGHLSTKADVATQQLSSPAVDGGSNNNSSNNVRTIFLTPKNSDIASGLSMLKKTLSSTQVMKLSKPNGPDDQQQQSQAHPRSSSSADRS